MSSDVDGTAFKLAAGAGRRFEAQAGAVLGGELDDIGSVTLEAIRIRARRHRRTGAMDRALTVSARGRGADRVVTVEAGGPEARWVIGGTDPHPIRAMHGHALRLAGTAQGFAAAVRHPGTAPDPFVARGIADAASDIDHITEAAADRLVDELADDVRS